MKKLTKIYLAVNVCVDEDFEDPKRIQAFRDNINAECGYDPQTNTTTTLTSRSAICRTELDFQKCDQQLKLVQTTEVKLAKENEKLRKDVLDMTNTIQAMIKTDQTRVSKQVENESEISELKKKIISLGGRV